MDALRDITTAYHQGQISSQEYRRQLALLILNNEQVWLSDLDTLSALIRGSVR